jgi:hypothetical protein
VGQALLLVRNAVAAPARHAPLQPNPRLPHANPSPKAPIPSPGPRPCPLPRCGHAMFNAGSITWQEVVLTVLYSIAGLGIAIVNDFKSIEGDRALGMNSLPVAFGIEKAKWLCVGTIDVTQLGVAAYLYAIGPPPPPPPPPTPPSPTPAAAPPTTAPPRPPQRSALAPPPRTTVPLAPQVRPRMHSSSSASSSRRCSRSSLSSRTPSPTTSSTRGPLSLSSSSVFSPPPLPSATTPSERSCLACLDHLGKLNDLFC